MKASHGSIAAMALVSFVVACGGSDSSGTGGGGSARVSMEGETFEVSDVEMTIEPGEDAWFSIDGEPADDPHEDCVPGLGGGIGFYGDLPSSVREPADLPGKRLRVDFSGDGDDANFCFAGMGGLAGAEDAWVTIDAVDGDRVRFSMKGTFKIYDERGEGPIVAASASGTAVLRRES
jgi:hypothetical protein